MGSFDRNFKFGTETENQGLKTEWRDEKYLEIRGLKALLVGSITHLMENKKIPLTDTSQYFHLQELRGNNIEIREKLLEALAKELEAKNIHYIFIPTNEVDSLKAFMEYFSNKIVFHDEFSPEYINNSLTKNPKKAFEMLDWYEKYFEAGKQQGLESPNDYQPPYFYVGADTNVLKQKNN